MTFADALPAALFGSRSASIWLRCVRILLSALLIGVGVDQVVSAIREWPLHDMDTYLAAAVRLRSGEALYAPDVAYNAYWYAPWFAVAWIPLSYLPREAVAVGWSAVLLAATGAICWRMARLGPNGLLLALLLGPSLFAVSAGGNVQSLMLLPLLGWSARRSGPVWVAIAASLKLTPMLFVLVYVRRRQWVHAAIAIGLAAVLVVPGLAMGLLGSSSGVSSGWGDSLLGISPVLFVATIGLAALGIFAVPDRFATLAAATASILALPRLFVYDATLLVAGTPSTNAPSAPTPSVAAGAESDP